MSSHQKEPPHNFFIKIWGVIEHYFSVEKDNRSPENSKKRSPYLNLAILLIAGIGILLIGDLIGGSPASEQPPPDAEEVIAFNQQESPAKELASQLEEVLEHVAGVRNVSVMLTMDTSSQSTYAFDNEEHSSITTETDSQGGVREVESRESSNTMVVLENSQGSQTPVLIVEQLPRVRGVVVVAEGVNSAQVEAWIVSALQALLDIPAHKISVLPRGN